MSVVLNPSSALGFPRPLTQHVKRSLAITNHNAQPVAFKVKTTAPKLYCVRPNSGRVEPGETVEVQVMLQAMKQEPPLNAKCKDKFLIQSTTITPEKETMPLQDMFNETTEDVHSQKIRVVYLPPEGQTVPEEDEQAGSILEPQGYRFSTVRETPGDNGYADHSRDLSGAEAPPPEEEHHDAPSSPPPPPAPQPAQPEESLAAEPEPIVNVEVRAPPSPPPPAPVAPLPDQTAELAAKLRDAQLEIERLRNLISSMPEPSTVPTTVTGSPSEMRRRRPFSDSGTATYDGETEVGTYMEELSQPEGVPLQVVIIVALGVFVTTYLFF